VPGPTLAVIEIVDELVRINVSVDVMVVYSVVLLRFNFVVQTEVKIVIVVWPGLLVGSSVDSE
jgi:hypothetical protein